jgi:acetyltransferase-like isoleucine patch superfamily enzyme
MQKIFGLLFRILRRQVVFCSDLVCQVACWIIFYGQNIICKGFITKGVPYVSIARGGKCNIGHDFKMNNNIRGNPIGRSQRCILFVDKGAELTIGNNVGMSSTAIVCHLSIQIGNDVKIGGGVCIYDTDFHSLDPTFRSIAESDKINTKTVPVIIKDNVFIGAHTTILKGSIIGRNAVIGACSVVTRNIPDNEIWAGNPAKKIKDVLF